MSSFHELGDEFAGDAANEEWDAAWAAYASGADTSQDALAAPLRAALRLPSGRVELRGEFDDEVIAVLADLHDEREPFEDLMGVDVAAQLATFVVRRRAPERPGGADADHTGGADVDPADAAHLPATIRPWWLEQHEHAEVDSGRGWESLATTLLARLEQVSIAADTGQVHIEAACVELDGTGIVLAGGTAADRDIVLHALLAEGASYLTRDDLVLQPGTRAVRGTPSPVWNPVTASDRGPTTELVPARQLAPVLEQCAVDVIVLLARPGTADTPVHDRAAPGGPTELEPAHAVVRLVDSLRPDGADGAGADAAVDQLALLVAGATCVEVPGVAGLVGLVDMIRGLEPPERRRIAARFHWSVPSAAAPSGGRRSRRGATVAPTRRRMVRFDRDAVLWDGADARVRLVDVDEADRLEHEVLSQLEHRPGPEAFGLPNCPSGATARQLWSSMSLLEPSGASDRDRGDDAAARDAGQQSPETAPAAAPDPDDLPTGVAAELASRGLVTSEDAQQLRVVARHVAGRERTESAVAVLEDVLDTAAASQILPVVVGSLVQAFDGPLPEHLTDVDRIDLLVRKEHLDQLSDDLEAHGFVAQPRTLSGTSLVAASDRRLEHPDRPGITVDLHRSLAAGPFGELVDPEEFHRRSVPFRLGHRWVPALHPEHRFVHACVRADRGGGREHLVELRDVVLAAPQVAPLLAEAMECSARWGATTSVLAVVRSASDRLPGLPTWLVERARHHDAPSRRRRRRPGRS